MNFATATDADLTAAAEAARKARDSLSLTTAETESARTRAVSLKKQIEDGKGDLPAAKAELATIERGRAELARDYAAKRGQAKAALAAVEREQSRRRHESAAAELAELTDDELEQRHAEIIDKRRELKELAKASQVELDKRAAKRSAAELVASLSDAEKAALLQELSAVGGVDAPKT